MESFHLDDIYTSERTPARAARAKPVKRKWREIEAIKDRQRLQRELMDLGIEGDFDLDEINL
ncbi:DUF3545 family protein [Vibrio ulleungensis]|uniref:DUF3545 family protein n=1 Tax=Vibrio ulleungensis TaxID=2807619 RepID=A0ABS2HPW1_9VIBR|nr:DUF3545 family protein [Vibrio ulleungensis]MBM7038084.1 DUF3545 family protein [Vibrio ulleungensis]